MHRGQPMRAMACLAKSLADSFRPRSCGTRMPVQCRTSGAFSCIDGIRVPGCCCDGCLAAAGSTVRWTDQVPADRATARPEGRGSICLAGHPPEDENVRRGNVCVTTHLAAHSPAFFRARGAAALTRRLARWTGIVGQHWPACLPLECFHDRNHR